MNTGIRRITASIRVLSHLWALVMLALFIFVVVQGKATSESFLAVLLVGGLPWACGIWLAWILEGFASKGDADQYPRP